MTGVNMVFFMGGPQLGELEAGAVANWFGAPFSVITGGIGCLLATGWVAATTPALRHYRRESGVRDSGSSGVGSRSSRASGFEIRARERCGKYCQEGAAEARKK